MPAHPQGLEASIRRARCEPVVETEVVIGEQNLHRSTSGLRFIEKTVASVASTNKWTAI